MLDLSLLTSSLQSTTYKNVVFSHRFLLTSLRIDETDLLHLSYYIYIHSSSLKMHFFKSITE